MTTINYFLEVSVSLGLFYLLYFLLFRKDTFFQRNRFYLLGSALLSLLIPLLDFNAYQAPIALPVRMLDTVIVGVQQDIEFSFSDYFYPFAMLIYGIFASLMLLRFMLSIKKVMNYITTKKAIAKNGYHLINTEGERPTASFMQYLFWDNSVDLKPQDAHKILQHELTHIKEKHSYDLLFMEILQIAFWFHPLVYRYKKELQKQHEFIADASVINNENLNSYTQLIVQRLFTELNLNLVHSFNNSSLIKNRIEMIKRTKTPNFLKFKTVLAIPVIAILFMTYACDDSVSSMGNDEVIVKKEKNSSLNSDIDTEVYEVVDNAASPIEGMKSVYQHIGKNLEYPKSAKENGIEGKVYVQFIIEKNGSISEVKAVKGFDDDCNNAAVQVVKAMPNWTGATHKGKKVRQKMVIPIKFALDD